MKEFNELLKVVRILRSPQGCPWDRAQKLEDYKKFLLEETYELIEGINQDRTEVVREEVGDLFLILVVITEFFREKEAFEVKDSLKAINEKLVSRHPHVFSSEKLDDKESVLKYWVENKAKKKKRETIKDRLPLSASAIFLAELFFKEKAHLEHQAREESSQKVDKIISGVINKLEKLKGKSMGEKALAEILFEIACIAFAWDIDLEIALREKVLREAEAKHYSSRNT